MAKRKLKAFTDKEIKALLPAEPGKRYDAMDTYPRGFGVRVSSTAKTFFLYTRFPGSTMPTRRTIGAYDGGIGDKGTLSDRRQNKVTLADARAKAVQWLELIGRGIDPQDQEQAERDAEQQRRDTTFRAVAEDFIRLKVRGKKPETKADVVDRNLRVEFIEDFKRTDGSKRKGLGDRPIDSIAPRDITRVLDDAVERDAIYQAHNLLGHVRRMFNWAIERGDYGIDRSPCDRMRPENVIGAPKEPRQRILKDDELFALWRNAARMGYPFGPFYQLLVLTGQRKTQVSEARWSEFDLGRKLWTIPAERMKMKQGHVVPLSDDAIAILKTLPRFNKQKGDTNPRDLLFSTTHGEKPISGFGKVKVRLDRRMLRTLKAMARKRGDDPDTVQQFVNHDIRRTMRTGLSTLGVLTEVSELVIAHTKKGILATYDLHAYEAEKRDALELWAAKLRSIVQPEPSNVVSFQRGA